MSLEEIDSTLVRIESSLDAMRDTMNEQSEELKRGRRIKPEHSSFPGAEASTENPNGAAEACAVLFGISLEIF